MRIPSRRSAWAALVAGSCLAGCASSTAPKGWLPRAVDAQSAAHGGWLSLRVTGGSRGTIHEGELLAIQADSVFILERGACLGMPIAQVAAATLTAYDADTGLLALWTLIGTLSTASHGAGLILSAPVWIVAGSVARASDFHASQRTLTPATWEGGRAYARFPQGLPEGLDRSSLRPK